MQVKFEKLSDEQKEQAVELFRHYLFMDCYDFGISIGGWSCYAGALASLISNVFDKESKESNSLTGIEVLKSTIG